VIVHAIGSHHEEEKPESMIDVSRRRAGRSFGSETRCQAGDVGNVFVKRLEDLERISHTFPGVEKSYAIQRDEKFV